MHKIREKIYVLIGTSFGLGYTPIVPGTAGALPGLAIYIVASLFLSQVDVQLIVCFCLLMTSFITVHLGKWAETYWQQKDPKVFVLDEVAGFLLTSLLFKTNNFWITATSCFLAFRVIDIIKIPPANWFEHLPHGWGILADDLCSALYAAGLLNLVVFLLSFNVK